MKTFCYSKTSVVLLHKPKKVMLGNIEKAIEERINIPGNGII